MLVVYTVRLARHVAAILERCPTSVAFEPCSFHVFPVLLTLAGCSLLTLLATLALLALLALFATLALLNISCPVLPQHTN